MVAAFLAQEPPFAKLPPALRRGLLWFFLRGSVLAPQMGVRTHRREPARPLLMIIAGATMLADLLT